MRLFLILTVSLSALSSSWAASGFVDSFEKDDVTGDYLHPKPEAFTDFRFISPLPDAFLRGHPRRKEMGDQYLDFMGVIAIVGETKMQRRDMRRVAHVLMGLIDNNQDGQPDDLTLWQKRKAETEAAQPLVLYVTQTKEKYKSFDDANPTLYHQGWSSVRDGNRLHLTNIQEELFHFLQRHLWEIEYPESFGLDRVPLSVAHAAAGEAIRQRHYVYDEDCITDPGCLVPEFFFCVMTDLMQGWKGKGFDAPTQMEWRLKGNVAAVRKNFPAMSQMVREMQKDGKLPRKWPSCFLIE